MPPWPNAKVFESNILSQIQRLQSGHGIKSRRIEQYTSYEAKTIKHYMRIRIISGIRISDNKEDPPAKDPPRRRRRRRVGPGRNDIMPITREN